MSMAEKPTQEPPVPAGAESAAAFDRAPDAGQPAPEGAAGPKEAILEESGEVQQDLIEIAGMDVTRNREREARLEAGKASKKETFYSDLIYTLTHLRYDEQEARVLWVNLLAHKYEMSFRLGRNVGIRVAALDYFRNMLGALEDVKIIDASAFVETAQLAIADGLTGLFNHRYFQDRLLRDITRAKEDGGCLSLLMLDLDQFKLYNDINGHIAGDVALKEVAGLLRRNLKRDDLVARYGGEEFAIILLGVDRSAARAVAERIRARVKEAPFPNEKVLPGGHLTVSIGVAECPTDAEERNDLIAAADRALYAAKRGGRNRVELAPGDPRRTPRWPVSKRVSYRLADAPPEAPVLECQALNVSAGGLCMVAPGAFVPGQVLKLTIAGLPEEHPLLARVVWCLPRPGGFGQVGLKFVNVPPEVQDLLTELGH